MGMPWLGHQVLVLSSLLLSCLYRNRGLVGTVRSDSLSNAQTTSFRHRLLPPSFATNASIAVSTHSRLKVYGRCGKDGARRGIARSRAQKFGNPVRLRLAAIRSIRVTRFDESSSAAAHPPRCHRRHPTVSLATPRYSSLSLLVLRFLLSAVLYLVGFELADGFVATSVLLLRTSSRGMPRSR